jgi:hypothetical protein
LTRLDYRYSIEIDRPGRPLQSALNKVIGVITMAPE